MNEQKIAEHCLSKQGAVLDYPFGPDPAVFKAGGKMFVLMFTKNGEVKLSMKCDAMFAYILRQQYPSIKPAYKSDQWISVLCDGSVPDEDILMMINQSYDLIFKALTKKTRERISSEIVKEPEMTAADVVDIIMLLEQNGIEIYVDGGWGVDALLGEQTRKHNDLDIALPHIFVPILRELLAARGYKDMPRDDTRDCNFVMGDNQRRLVDVHSYTFDGDGKNIFGVAYEPRHLTGSGIINGYPVKCPPPDVMVEFHTGYIVDKNDYHDAKALCERFNIPLPKDFEKFETL